jgi:aldehyde:ferredoxin oxidoreductase
MQTYGTPNIVVFLQAMGVLPTRNWQANTFAQAQNISGEAMRARMFKALEPCTGCPIACGKLSEIREGPNAGIQVRGPELETFYALGSLVALDSVEKVAYANHLCNDLGLDTISTGVTIAFAMELFERGLLTTRDTDGVELSFGDADAVCELIKKIAYREGLGDLLAQGTRRAARRIGAGAEAYAMHTKGMELPAYDPRGMKAMGLAYATADRGGCHLRASTLNIELRGLVDEPVDRFAHEGKARYIKNIQDAWATVDALIYCKFGGYAIVPALAARLLEAVTGVEYGLDGLLEAGERIYNLTRLYNTREGLTRADDSLPRRLLTEGTTDGPSAGQKVDLDIMLDEYYELRGWDRDGLPRASTLSRLGLEREGSAAGIDSGSRG